MDPAVRRTRTCSSPPVDIVRDLPTGFTVMRAETVRRPGVPPPAPIDAIVRAVRSEIEIVQETT